MKKILATLFMTAITAVSCIYDDPDPGFELKTGDRIPEFTVQMSDGTAMTSGQLSQGAALIMFFNTECPDCQNTLPSVQKIYDEYKDKVTMALISREQSYEEIIPYWQEKGYTMPFSPQQDRIIYNLFATSGIPRVYICNNGKITNYYTDDPIPQYDELLTDLLDIIPL